MGVCIKQIEFRENVKAFPKEKENCLKQRDVHINEVSLQQDSTVVSTFKNDSHIFISTGCRQIH